MGHSQKRVSLLLLIALCTYNTEGYGGGAPAEKAICTDMLPGHGEDSQTIPLPFEVAINNYKPLGGEKIQIVLSAPEDEYFKGFLAMIKKPGDASKSYGKFSATSDPQAQAINCFNQPQSAMTHNSAEEKETVTLEWTAPNDEDLAELELVVTFVREADEIWQATKHPQKITVKRNVNYEKKRIYKLYSYHITTTRRPN